MFEAKIYSERRKKLKEIISDGLILLPGNVDSPMNCAGNSYHFRQDSSFLYFFGIDLPQLVGIIDADTGEEILFGDDVDIEDVIWVGPQPAFSDNAAEVGIQKSFPFKKIFEFVSSAVQKGRKVHFLPPYRAENKFFLQELLGINAQKQKDYASVKLIKAIISLRSIKEPCEIDELVKAANAGFEMHVTAMKMALPGTWEQKIAGKIEGISIAHGSIPSFPIILTQNGETLHNHSHSNFLEKGRLLLVDAGAETTMRYASDFTRVSPVGGKFTEKQREIYEIVLKANDHASSLCRPGPSYLSIHLEAAKVIASGLKELGLMKGDVDQAVKAGAHALFLPHGLGHMMGLDVHDMEDLGQNFVGYDDEIQPSDQFGTGYLRLGRKLEKGFVITVEPGIYFIPALIDKWKAKKINTDFINFDKVETYKGFGGIRLEDDLLITDDGYKLIGKRIPIIADEVEDLI